MTDNCVEEIIWDPSQILFRNEQKPTMNDIAAKYNEAVKRAFKASVEVHDGAVNGKTELVEKAMKRNLRYTHYAIALGWVLGIPRDTTEYKCDCEL